MVIRVFVLTMMAWCAAVSADAKLANKDGLISIEFDQSTVHEVTKILGHITGKVYYLEPTADRLIEMRPIVEATVAETESIILSALESEGFVSHSLEGGFYIAPADVVPSVDSVHDLIANSFSRGVKALPVGDGMPGIVVVDIGRDAMQTSGLRVGDVITHINGVLIDESDESGEQLAATLTGGATEFRILRDGEPLVLYTAY